MFLSNNNIATIINSDIMLRARRQSRAFLEISITPDNIRDP